MVSMKIVYQGDKHCEATHGPSSSKLSTDAPKDNHGRGETFSPTDLVGTALGSCILTTMAIQTQNDGIDLKGSWCEVEKEMTSNPRRIGRLVVRIHLPADVASEFRPKLEGVAHSCPVTQSLHPDLRLEIQFHYSV